MSDLAKPLILFLDPDEDFLEDMDREARTRDVGVICKVISKREPVDIEQCVLDCYADIVIVNLDQSDEMKFGDPVSEILRTPIPLAPIILGTTNKDSSTLKSKAYALGIDDYLIRPFTSKDVWFRIDVLLRTRRLQKQLDDATRKLSISNQTLNSSNRQLEEMTLTDELTGLNNMRFVTQYLEKQFHVFARFNRTFTLMMIDLDHFKEVNDQNDHLVGSDTIRCVGQIISQSTRGGDVKARYGGDEYIIAMPETDLIGARVVAERIREAVQAHDIIGHHGKIFKVTASIGVAPFLQAAHTSYKDLIRDADYALFLAKKGGRNQTVIYDATTASSKSRDASYDENQSGVMTELKKIKE